MASQDPHPFSAVDLAVTLPRGLAKSNMAEAVQGEPGRGRKCIKVVKLLLHWVPLFRTGKDKILGE